jgi:iron complex outermembrane recepter protein
MDGAPSVSRRGFDPTGGRLETARLCRTSFLSLSCFVSAAFGRFPPGARRLAIALLAGVGGVSPAAAQLRPEGPPILLDALIVNVSSTDDEDGFDPTGMGTREAELQEAPFSNAILWDGLPEDTFHLNRELENSPASPATRAEIAVDGYRLRLRGFPTPRLRDGYSQAGVPEILNVQRTETIQGPLIAVTGRGAPGGIHNHVTHRPRTRQQSRLDLEASDRYRRAQFQATGPLQPKKVWQRVALDWDERRGPQVFARESTTTLTGAMSVRATKTTSAMIQVDHRHYHGNPSPGVAEYRTAPGTKILGPYQPLAYIHAYGPHAGVRRDVSSATLQIENQPHPRLTLRAAIQALTRKVVEDRFTRGVYELDSGIFGGIREPMHMEQPMEVLATQVDVTARISTLGLEHKLLLALENISSDVTREQRALTAADRQLLLPPDVLRYDPLAPNYYRPSYSRNTYKRVVTDRTEKTEYQGVVLSDRTALRDGRLVTSVGGRFDRIELDVEDRRPGARFPHMRDTTDELTWHAGANYVLIPGRLLAFANRSTAFEPSTRVDARTGKIQGNEITSGFEAGFKTVVPQRLDCTVIYFDFANENISRRNPLYNDPALDPNLTEPELLAAGEEVFRGGMLDLRLQLAPAWRLNLRSSYSDAATTRSPDQPEEVGRPLVRMPRLTASINTRYSWRQGPLAGTSAGLGADYTDEFVARYADSHREYLAYPSITQVNAQLNYEWKQGTHRHEFGLRINNLLEADYLARLDLPGRDREVRLTYALHF